MEHPTTDTTNPALPLIEASFWVVLKRPGTTRAVA